jgi:hypothetical protein
MPAHLATTSSIAVGGRSLLRALRAKDDLARTAYVDDLIALSGHVSPLAFRFEGAAEGTASGGQSPEEQLVGTVLEFQTANVLLAAGSAAESADQGDDESVRTISSQLEAAVVGLEATTQSLQGSTTSEFGFLPRSPPPPPPIRRAKVTASHLKERAKSAIAGLIDDSTHVIDRTFEQLKKLDPSKALEAIQALGSQVPALKAAGRLIAIGLEKLKHAYEALIGWAGVDRLKYVQETVAQFWESALKGEYSKKALAFVYDQDGIAQLVDETCERSGLDELIMGSADAEIAALAASFKGQARALAILVDVAGVTVTILRFTPVAGQSIFIGAGVYATILGTVLLIGARCAGGRLPRWGRSIRDVVVGVVPSPLLPAT